MHRYITTLKESKIELLIALFSITLLIVWPLPHTIGLRNICIAFGSILSMCFFLRHKKIESGIVILLVVMLLSIPLLQVLRVVFFENSSAYQMYELKGTWLRVFALIIMGFAFGQILVTTNNNIFLYALLIGFLFHPVVTIILYLKEIVIFQNFLPVNFTSIFNTKISGVYFNLWFAWIGFGVIYWLLRGANISSRLQKLGIIISSVGIIIVVIDILALRALNGVLNIIGLGVLLLILLLFRSLFYKSKFNHKIFLTIFLIVTFTGIFAIEYDARHDGKLKNLLQDVVISSDLNATTLWRDDDLSRAHEERLPVNQNGVRVNASTYERVSWFLKGLDYLGKNPMGTGFTHHAFGYLMRQDYPGSRVEKTHSGWMDLALGLGLPSMFLLWAILALNICLAVKSKANARIEFICTVGMLMMLGLAAIWVTGEIAEREFIEHTFFMLSVFTGLNSLHNRCLKK